MGGHFLQTQDMDLKINIAHGWFVIRTQGTIEQKDENLVYTVPVFVHLTEGYLKLPVAASAVAVVSLFDLTFRQADHRPPHALVQPWLYYLLSYPINRENV